MIQLLHEKLKFHGRLLKATALEALIRKAADEMRTVLIVISNEFTNILQFCWPGYKWSRVEWGPSAVIWTTII